MSDASESESEINSSDDEVSSVGRQETRIARVEN